MQSKTKIIDYFKGFEGEPEYYFIQRNQFNKDIIILKLWGGYFDKIISRIDTSSNGNWEGVTLHYHNETGWYDEPWECSDINLLLNQLESIDVSGFGNVENNILNDIKILAKNCLEMNHRLIIQYE